MVGQKHIIYTFDLSNIEQAKYAPYFDFILFVLLFKRNFKQELCTDTKSVSFYLIPKYLLLYNHKQFLMFV